MTGRVEQLTAESTPRREAEPPHRRFFYARQPLALRDRIAPNLRIAYPDSGVCSHLLQQ
jgi:hypothetical protein